MNQFFNKKRLRTYPILIAITVWAVYILNFIFRDGWRGILGGHISFDFLTFYAISKIYWQETARLYDFAYQFQVEQEVFAPTSLQGGGNIFSYPPYVALFSGLLNIFRYDWAFYIFTIFSLFCVAFSAYLLIHHLVPPWLIGRGLTYDQLLISIFSFYPVIIGINLGQNHILTLLILSILCIASLQQKWFLAGVASGLLLYKPHLVLGFLIVWLAWKRWKALAAFTIIALIIFMSVILTKGLEPYFSYIKTLPQLLLLPYGVGRFVEATVSALLATLLPIRAAPGITLAFQIILVFLSLGLWWIARRLDPRNPDQQAAALVLALLFPFFVSPHLLIHDLVILVPVFILWARISRSTRLLYTLVLTYFASFLFLFISFPTGIAFLGLIPIGIAIAFLADQLPMLRVTTITRN